MVKVIRINIGQGKSVDFRFLVERSRRDGKSVRGFEQEVSLRGSNLLTVHILDDRGGRPAEIGRRGQVIGDGAYPPVEHATLVLKQTGKDDGRLFAQWRVERTGYQVIRIP